MEADGGLQLKIDASVKMVQVFASAIENYKGNWVPTVVMGGGRSDVAGSGAMQLVEFLTAKTARDLSIDWGLPGLEETKTQGKKPGNK